MSAYRQTKEEEMKKFFSSGKTKKFFQMFFLNLLGILWVGYFFLFWLVINGKIPLKVLAGPFVIAMMVAGILMNIAQEVKFTPSYKLLQFYLFIFGFAAVSTGGYYFAPIGPQCIYWSKASIAINLFCVVQIFVGVLTINTVIEMGIAQRCLKRAKKYSEKGL